MEYFLLAGAPAKLFQEIHPDWAPSVRMGRPIRLKPKSRAFLSSQSIIQSRVSKKKKNEENAGRDSKPKIVESSERKGNKINNRDKLNGILFEHFYCKKVSSDNNSHPESSDVIICDSEKPSPSENKELEPISQTVPNKANSNKVDVACMTAITSDYVTYMQDELNKIKKNSSYKEQILKSTNDIAEIAEMNNINLQGQLAAAKTELEMYRKDNIALREEIIAMRSCITQLSLNQAALKTDNNKVKLYTGFPNFKLLNHFYNFIASDFQTHLSNSLNKFEEFLVVLMRLRLNASGRDLGYRFGVSQGTISRICSRWIPIMAQKLEGLEWSEKISFRKNVPICFREVFEDQVSVIVIGLKFFLMVKALSHVVFFIFSL